MSVKDNINNFREQIPATCKLIAVSKTHPVDRIKEAYDAGQRLFGENKVQELAPKYEALPRDIQWHMIGHMQSNKVKYIASFIHLIHSVDSFSLLKEIDKQARKNQRQISCLLQMHIATEETKFGFSEDEILQGLETHALKNFSNVRVMGLMGMATFTDDRNQIRDEFRRLRNFYNRLKEYDLPSNVIMEELSMGMSSDYDIAIEEGSTMIRVGSSIFGDRTYAQS